MAEKPLVACGACGNRVHSTDQRTCPHCLQRLEPRRFNDQRTFQAFQEDRSYHGDDVEPLERPKKRGIRGVLIFAAVLMVMAGGGIILGGMINGSVAQTTRALYQAMIPLAMGAALFAVAYRYGGA